MEHPSKAEMAPLVITLASLMLFYFSWLRLAYGLGTTGLRKKGLRGERGLRLCHYRAHFVGTCEYEVRYRLVPFKALRDTT